MSPVRDPSPFWPDEFKPWPDEFNTSPSCMPGPRAVVAEEDPCLRYLIACLLAGEGLFVTEVSDTTALVHAAVARDFDSTEPFNLIVADLPMSGYAGLDALKRLREEGCQGPAVVISSSLDHCGTAQLERLHAEHLTKPFEHEKLRALASRIRAAYDKARSSAACPL